MGGSLCFTRAASCACGLLCGPGLVYSTCIIGCTFVTMYHRCILGPELQRTSWDV